MRYKDEKKKLESKNEGKERERKKKGRTGWRRREESSNRGSFRVVGKGCFLLIFPLFLSTKMFYEHSWKSPTENTINKQSKSWNKGTGLSIQISTWAFSLSNVKIDSLSDGPKMLDTVTSVKLSCLTVCWHNWTVKTWFDSCSCILDTELEM